MDIKEIAERVSKRIYVEDGLLLSKFISEKFAEALIAEIAKQNEPVAFTNSAQLGYVTSGQHQDIPLAMWSRNTSYSGADIPLYTFPPTAEQIANETAEACAELADKMNPFPEPSAIGPEIRSGEWRKFVKEMRDEQALSWVHHAPQCR